MVLERSIEKYQDSDVPFGAYFALNLKNRLITLKGRNVRKSTIIVDDSLLLYERGSSIDQFDEYGVLSTLDEEERKVVVSYYLKNRSVEYISKELGIKKMDVYYILKKSREKMKKHLME